MLDTQVIDLRGHIEPIKIEIGADVYISLNEADKELKIILGFNDLDNIVNEVNKQIGLHEIEEELKLEREYNEDHVIL